MIIGALFFGMVFGAVCVMTGFMLGGKTAVGMFWKAEEYRRSLHPHQQPPPLGEPDDYEDEKTIEDFLIEQVHPGTYIWETNETYLTSSRRRWHQKN